jgi:uncharacterized delta-60 repeat protein
MPSFFHRLLRRVAALAIALAPAAAAGITVDGGDGNVKTGVFSSVAILDGFPAIAYGDDQNIALKFIRASDASGTTWGPPVIVELNPSLAGRPCLLLLGGVPSVCYFDYVASEMKIFRAANAAGTVWNPPFAVSMGPATPVDCDIKIVDGNPAICYGDATGIQFRRAADVGGFVWESPVGIQSAEFAYEPVMTVVEDHPAVVYTGTGGLWYQRAADASGKAWGPMVKVATISRLSRPHYISMQVVNGRPSVSYVDDLRGNLMFVRALDATGSAWGAPVRTDASGSARSPSLAVVNGGPAIGYYTFGSFDLKYVAARDDAGATAEAWESPGTVESDGDTGIAPSLLEVDGRPALIYHHATRGSLEYLRAARDGPGPRWPAALIVLESDHITRVPDGATQEFGIVPVGTSASLMLMVSNPNSGSVEFTGFAVSIDGPDAAEFSIRNTPGGTLVGGVTLPFKVEYAPVKPGLKSAVLHITGSTVGTTVSFHFPVTGSSAPDIAVEWPAGTVLADDATLLFKGNAATDGIADLVFTVRNRGGADLNSLAATIDGPDWSEFSVVVPPPPLVPPNHSVFFTVRVTPRTSGAKTAKLHLSSNLTGTRNPFDLTLVYTVDAASTSGATDQSFNAVTGQVQALVIQADGRILAGGVQNVKRFDPDGSPDLNFFSSPISGGTVLSFAIQRDGGILLGGNFARVGGFVRQGLARLLPDGSVDTAFEPGFSGVVYCLAVQPDGKILTGGSFVLAGNPSTHYLSRFNSNGSLDPGFYALPNDAVLCLAPHPGGRVVIGGRFTRVSDAAALHIARLDGSGSPEPFSAAFDGDVQCLAVQPDGRIFAGGLFGGGMARLFPDGTRDTSVSSLFNGAVYDFALQTDGRCLAAGTFNYFTGFPRNRIARFHADGSLDLSFESKVDAATYIQRLAIQEDGRVLVAGKFTGIDGVARSNIARLKNSASSTWLKTENLSTVRWQRTGPAPEVSDVTFEMSTPGSPDWVALGSGTRVAGGWELTGLTLPEEGSIRARARAGGSVVESIAPVLTSIDLWRRQQFGPVSIAGEGADKADPDHDGLTNFLEFALNGNPLSPDSGKVRETVNFVASGPVVTFTVPVRTGAIADPDDPAGGPLVLKKTEDALRYSVQASSDLINWILTVSEIKDTGASLAQAGLPPLDAGWEYRSFRGPPGMAKLYMRVAVSE